MPIHPKEDIGRGLLRKIAADAKTSPDQFAKLIERDP